MTRRLLMGLAALALWLFASPSRAQQAVPAPPSQLVPAAPGVPAAPPAAAPPTSPAPEAAPNAFAPAPPAGTASPAAPEQPWAFDVAPPARGAAPTSPARVPFARRWWFWTALGAAAVGLVAVAIALSPPDPYHGNANPGVVSAPF